MPTRTSESVRTDLDQDVWWKTRDGLVRLVDDLDDSHRVNVATFLIDRASTLHFKRRRAQIWYDWIAYETAGWEAWVRGSWGPVDPNEAPTYRSTVRQIRREQDRGAHLDWMRTRPMFVRMCRGVEHLLPPGVL